MKRCNGHYTSQGIEITWYVSRIKWYNDDLPTWRWGFYFVAVKNDGTKFINGLSYSGMTSEGLNLYPSPSKEQAKGRLDKAIDGFMEGFTMDEIREYIVRDRGIHE